jgi:hypothetical protein
MNRRRFLKIGGAGLAGLALAPRRSFAAGPNAWSFGVMADTQWRTGSSSGGEPASCAVTIIDALNQQFVNHGVKFVIQVGDLVDVESVSGVRSLQTRAAHAQALYNAGIGFFPVRGNHESSQTAAGEMQVLFPQNQGSGPNLFGATDFESPVMPVTATDPLGTRLKGLSYSFVYDNVQCVLIDQFVRTDGTNYGSSSYNDNAVDQIPWVSSVLGAKPAGRHGFVFAHKNIAGQNHKDVLFGASQTSNPGPRDEFIASLSSAGVRYFMSGHDHMHYRSVIGTLDGHYDVGQVICSSNSYKFYIPSTPYQSWDVPVAEEIFTIGYYIVTVDGPRVTVDFYSSSHGADYGDIDLVAPPGAFAFYLRETFGYSLNGKRFRIVHGESYTAVQDSYNGTSARILSGTNGDTHTDEDGRALTKSVSTGWTAPSASDPLASNILSLWGMQENLSLYDAGLTGLLPNAAATKRCDTYALAVTYDPKKARPSQIVSGQLVLATRNSAGNWVNAVDQNFSGGAKTFKYGPWRPEYPLGTYGVDPGTLTAWAVLNHDGDFAAKLS